MMDNNISQASLLEIAIVLMGQKHGKQNIKKLISEVLEVKGIEDEDKTVSTQLYIDITTCSKFVYMGNEEWDLKERQPLEEWDKDGSAFNPKGQDDDDDEGVKNIELENEEDDEDKSEFFNDEDFDEEYEDEYSEDEEIDFDTDDNGELLDRYDEDDFDEDEYNDYMDEFEDRYEN